MTLQYLRRLNLRSDLHSRCLTNYFRQLKEEVKFLLVGQLCKTAQGTTYVHVGGQCTCRNFVGSVNIFFSFYRQNFGSYRFVCLYTGKVFLKTSCTRRLRSPKKTFLQTSLQDGGPTISRTRNSFMHWWYNPTKSSESSVSSFFGLSSAWSCSTMMWKKTWCQSSPASSGPWS